MHLSIDDETGQRREVTFPRPHSTAFRPYQGSPPRLEAVSGQGPSHLTAARTLPTADLSEPGGGHSPHASSKGRAKRALSHLAKPKLKTVKPVVFQDVPECLITAAQILGISELKGRLLLSF